MDPRLLELLVCPLCKGPLEHLHPPAQPTPELVCHHDKLAFPVRDGIPLMLESEARDLNAGATHGPGDARTSPATTPSPP